MFQQTTLMPTFLIVCLKYVDCNMNCNMTVIGSTVHNMAHRKSIIYFADIQALCWPYIDAHCTSSYNLYHTGCYQKHIPVFKLCDSILVYTCTTAIHLYFPLESKLIFCIILNILIEEVMYLRVNVFNCKLLLALLGSSEILGGSCIFKWSILPVLGCWLHTWTTLCIRRV